MNERMERLEAAVNAILGYIEDLKGEYDTERFDAVVEKLEAGVPHEDTTDSEEIDEAA